MLYVGKSNPREKVRRNNQIIEREKLAHVLPSLTLIWFFWVRIESMWHSKSKLQHQNGHTPENDPILQEIMTMLSFDGSDQGWAVICGGAAPHEMAKGKGETMWNSFERFDAWKERVPPLGFVKALDEDIHEHQTPHHCNRLILPGANGTIPERVVCAECGRSMEKYIMYRCCTD
uniref:Sieve element occlusion C-terminal domain-containing protein n=1 Tax=Kalanchoe fedtschenkoi TaxID=63787 RepID=A0A7N0TEQ3_KALFE